MNLHGDVLHILVTYKGSGEGARGGRPSDGARCDAASVTGDGEHCGKDSEQEDGRWEMEDVCWQDAPFWVGLGKKRAERATMPSVTSGGGRRAAIACIGPSAMVASGPRCA